ncbi:NAD(P)-binding protein [Wilcoxina mikolae CBS 423.85]|nr:NAD(P)-binding protein [Wilcoxina mikolae CBS 423.85]
MVKVAIAGTGALAQHIAHASLSLGHEVLLLSRHENPSLSPLTVIAVDYSLPSSLCHALTDVHTLISTIPHSVPQLALIDACLMARVSRFAPAEFERAPNLRPFVGGGDGRLDVLEKLRTERHRLDSAVFVCGLFMERFGPGGKGDMLLDFAAGRAWIPVGEGEEGRACFIAVKDVGMFVANALGLEEWPEQFRCCGERLGIAEAVEIAERVRGWFFVYPTDLF